ncbi:MAG: hypothetical protein N2999_01210 [Proteobacteria bacterium]|nr:hypothetical protein [Pseudomonadota bacterium]
MSSKIIKFVTFFIIISFFAGCARELVNINKSSELIIKGVGYLELYCGDYYFYGDILTNGNKDFFEISIYNFGNEILKINELNDKIKILYLGGEIKDDYFQLFPMDINFLVKNLKRYFLEQPLDKSDSIFFETENDKKILNIIRDNCRVKIFLAKES